jgi:chromatin remodeling complex protein RSC6
MPSKKQSQAKSTKTAAAAATTATAAATAATATATAAATAAASTTATAAATDTTVATDSEVEVEVEVVDTFETLFASMNERVNNLYACAKSVRSDMKELEKMHKKEIKTSRKHKRSSGNGNKNPSGFNKPTPVPSSVVKLLGLEEGVELPRTQITKLIYGYIKEHDLQVPEDKRTINPDARLIKLFALAPDEQISFYNIQSHIKKLYTPPATEEVAVTETKKKVTKSS